MGERGRQIYFDLFYIRSFEHWSLTNRKSVKSFRSSSRGLRNSPTVADKGTTTQYILRKKNVFHICLETKCTSSIVCCVVLCCKAMFNNLKMNCMMEHECETWTNIYNIIIINGHQSVFSQ